MSVSFAAALNAAQAAAADQHYPQGALYVVATPIGNLADISLRAVHVLARVDAVACEDTRVGAQLLRHLGLHKPLLALHAHNEHEAGAAVLRRLAAGEAVAVISDAGTPAVSDPGAVVVAAAAAAGHRVVPIPGPSSALAALCAAGDTEGAGFCFVGFLPAKGGERQRALAAVLAETRPQVLFEAPHRIEALVQALAVQAAGRRVSLCRELTKQFEQVHTAMAESLPAWLAEDPQRCKGEFVVVVHAQALAQDDTQAHDRLLGLLLQELPLKSAVKLAAEISGAPRNALYERALKLREAATDSDPE